ncbi:CinA family nicotinamide mononucleotide deamidase-related protein [Geomonas sp.]|uniref:CinA family nicotinamide mononucleotide deamidase-related protein n=1 Tax=Geomonas sp. TaxID=2651584 RepID=UPI002B45AF23|nr:CinA family nicotinamide mononucleotide deamidase-related protein [Geomonas sp.]HJV34390.1 CinA family nicotinamide mononucleotide deamidase-related protein [Geomonas sp.]
MKIATLSIGDELLTGEIVDTNAAHIAGRLYDAGVRVARHLTVADDEEAIVAALRELSAGHQAVVVTGGLGSTPDDLTTKAAARVAGVQLEVSAEALEHLGSFSNRTTGGLHPKNLSQALLPAGCTLIPNPLGTACGFQLTLDGCRFFFMPGVPFEMERMLDDTVLPTLAGEGKGGWRRITLKLFGISEAAVAARLEGCLPADSPVELAYCVKFPEVHLILRADVRHLELLEKSAAEIRGRLSAETFGRDDETMDDVLAALFRKSGKTLALAESCTGGMIAARITRVAGSSAYFLEGNVTYSNQAKSRMLSVPPELIIAHGAVSSEVACAMATGARQAAGSDLALSVTGIAGPEGGSDEKPVGTVHIAMADGVSCRVERYNFPGDREAVRGMTCFTALDWLRCYLLALQK